MSRRFVYQIHWWARARFRAAVIALGCPYVEHKGGVFEVEITAEQEAWLDAEVYL